MLWATTAGTRGATLFRCLQLPLDVSDPDVVAAAFKAVEQLLNRNLKSGTNAGPAKVLQSVLGEADAVLTDPARRRQHRTQVLEERAALQASLREELGDLPGVPPAAVPGLLEARQRFHTRREIVEALAAIGRPVQDPVELPPFGKAPTKWKTVQHDVAFLGLPSLYAYLQKHFGAATTVTVQQLLDRQTTLQRTASGDVLTSEMSIVSNVKTWVAAGQLTELLRADLLRELGAEASMGGERLTAALKARGIDRQLDDLGLPPAREIAYALLCALRYPAEQATSWQASYRDARTNRDLRVARDILVANRPALDKQFGKELDTLDAEIAEIDAAVRRARGLERTDPEAAAVEYVQVLQRCRDPEVESALRRCRPAEPARTAATVGGDSVTVEWAPTTARAGEITYRVVRHVAGGGPGDGATVGAGLTGITVVDTAAPAGVALTYSVWTLRNDEPSPGACTTRPVAVLRPVRNLELVPGEDVVEVRWELPDGATGARVTRRQDGADAGRPRRVQGTHLRDTDVRTGITYEYVVESEYRLADGTTGHGRAVTDRIRPQRPPQPVRDLATAVEADALVLTWTAPERGEVEVRVLDAAPDVRPGAAVGTTERARLGRAARVVGARRDGHLRTALPEDGRRHWLLPLTVVDGMAVAGVAVEYDSRLPAVSELRADQLGNRVQLRWTWPPRVSEVLVVSRAGTPPAGPDDPAATRKRLTHALYQRSGATVAAVGTEQWIGVCVTAFTEGVPVYGPMVTVSASVPPELSYEIQRVSGFRNRRLRRLVVSADGARTPPAVRVVARVRLPPLSPDDGVELAAFPAPPPGTTTFGGEFPLTERGRPLFLRAFPADGDAVVLVPANPAQLRID